MSGKMIEIKMKKILCHAHHHLTNNNIKNNNVKIYAVDGICKFQFIEGKQRKKKREKYEK